MNPNDLNELRSELCRLEQSESIRVLHLAECDSRAWGFSTDDSDYDLRFCFYKLPWAHTIQKTAETLRHKVRINGVPCDMQGFSLDHVLNKVGRSSFAMYEMFFSPLQLATHEHFRPLFVAAADQYFEPVDVMNFCRGLMRKNFEFVKPFDAKHMLHAMRFALMAERLKNGKPLLLNLPELLADSGFADKASELLRARDDKFWTPDVQVVNYLYRMCHTTEWPVGKEFVERNAAWANDLNSILQYVVRRVCDQHEGMSAEDLNWSDDVSYQESSMLKTGDMKKAVHHDVHS